MTVYVNDIETKIFQGATAQDAARRFSTDTGTPLPPGQLYDSWGNIIAPDSPMTEGRRIYTVRPR